MSVRARTASSAVRSSSLSNEVNNQTKEDKSWFKKFPSPSDIAIRSRSFRKEYEFTKTLENCENPLLTIPTVTKKLAGLIHERKDEIKLLKSRTSQLEQYEQRRAEVYALNQVMTEVRRRQWESGMQKMMEEEGGGGGGGATSPDDVSRINQSSSPTHFLKPIVVSSTDKSKEVSPSSTTNLTMSKNNDLIQRDINFTSLPLSSPCSLEADDSILASPTFNSTSPSPSTHSSYKEANPPSPTEDNYHLSSLSPSSSLLWSPPTTYPKMKQSSSPPSSPPPHPTSHLLSKNVFDNSSFQPPKISVGEIIKDNDIKIQNDGAALIAQQSLNSIIASPIKTSRRASVHDDDSRNGKSNGGADVDISQISGDFSRGAIYKNRLENSSRNHMDPLLDTARPNTTSSHYRLSTSSNTPLITRTLSQSTTPALTSAPFSASASASTSVSTQSSQLQRRSIESINNFPVLSVSSPIASPLPQNTSNTSSSHLPDSILRRPSTTCATAYKRRNQLKERRSKQQSFEPVCGMRVLVRDGPGTPWHQGIVVKVTIPSIPKKGKVSTGVLCHVKPMGWDKAYPFAECKPLDSRASLSQTGSESTSRLGLSRGSTKKTVVLKKKSVSFKFKQKEKLNNTC